MIDPMADRPRFRVISGDILGDPGIPLVPVNCVPGVMGKGLAKAFADKYPTLDREHGYRVRNGDLFVGKPCLIYWMVDHDRPLVRPFIFFPTKRHWRYPSRIEWVGDGLATLSEILARYESRRDGIDLAVPALGCGEGGLDFGLVGPLISAWAAGLPERFSVTLYRPA